MQARSPVTHRAGTEPGPACRTLPRPPGVTALPAGTRTPAGPSPHACSTPGAVEGSPRPPAATCVHGALCHATCQCMCFCSRGGGLCNLAAVHDSNHLSCLKTTPHCGLKQHPSPVPPCSVRHGPCSWHQIQPSPCGCQQAPAWNMTHWQPWSASRSCRPWPQAGPAWDQPCSMRLCCACRPAHAAVMTMAMRASAVWVVKGCALTKPSQVTGWEAVQQQYGMHLYCWVSTRVSL